MTEEELSNLNPQPESSEYAAKIVVEAFESRFPELLKDESRRLLFSFIDNSFFHFMDCVKLENARFGAALAHLSREDNEVCRCCPDLREFCNDALGWKE